MDDSWHSPIRDPGPALRNWPRPDGVPAGHGQFHRVPGETAPKGDTHHPNWDADHVRAVVQRVLSASVTVDGAVVGATARTRAAGLRRRHPHRRSRRGGVAGPQAVGAAAAPRRAVGLRRGRADPRGQPVHAVRRRAQGPPSDLAGRRTRARSPSRSTRPCAPSSSGSVPTSSAACSAPTCGWSRSTTARSRCCSRRHERLPPGITRASRTPARRPPRGAPTSSGRPRPPRRWPAGGRRRPRARRVATRCASAPLSSDPLSREPVASAPATG